MKSFYTKLHGAEFRVLRLQEIATHSDVIDTPVRMVAYLRAQLAVSPTYNPDVENMYVVHLNTRYQPIGLSLVAHGTLGSILVHAREVFRAAIVANSAAVILAHNHPSGDPTPSEADIHITRNLISCGDLLNIKVLDHIILGRPTPFTGPANAPISSKHAPAVLGHSSLRELGHFYGQ